MKWSVISLIALLCCSVLGSEEDWESDIGSSLSSDEELMLFDEQFSDENYDSDITDYDSDDDEDQFLSSLKHYFGGVVDDYKWAYHYYKHKVVKNATHFGREVADDYRFAGQQLRGLAGHIKSKIEDIQNHAAATLLSGMRWSRSHALKLLNEFSDMERTMEKDAYSMYRKVKKRLKRWEKILRYTLDHVAPDLLVLGVSGQAGPGLLGAEYVMDFTKNSHATFGYAGVSCGLNSGSLGVSVGTGICWKGRAKSQSLKNAYSGWFGVANVDVSLPFDLLSVGAAAAISFARDGDGMLKPHPELVKCGQVHIGAGVSLNPLPGSVDVQLTDYKYLRGKSGMSNTQMVGDIVKHLSGDPFMMSMAMALTYANTKS